MNKSEAKILKYQTQQQLSSKFNGVTINNMWQWNDNTKDIKKLTNKTVKR